MKALLNFYYDGFINDLNIQFKKILGIPVTGRMDELPMVNVYFDTSINIDVKDSNKNSTNLSEIINFISSKNVTSLYYIPFSNLNCNLIIDSLKEFLKGVDRDIVLIPLTNGIIFNKPVDRVIESMARLYTETGCSWTCTMCTIERTVKPNNAYVYHLHLIKEYVNCNNWIYLGNPTFIPHYISRAIIEDYLHEFKLIVQTRINVINAYMKELEKLNNIKVIEVGVESFANHVLDGIKKGITKNDIIDTLTKLREVRPDIIIVVNLMWGTPYHVEQDYILDLVNLRSLHNKGIIDYINFTFMADYNSVYADDWCKNTYDKSWIKEDIDIEYYQGELMALMKVMLKKLKETKNETFHKQFKGIP